MHVPYNMTITKRTQQQQQNIVLKDNIYLRPVTLDDLQRAQEIANVVNAAFVSDDGWTSITSFFSGDKVSLKDIQDLIHDTVNYEKTKTMLLCAFAYDPKTEKEIAIGTFLIQGGGQGKGSTFPATVQRTDVQEEQQQLVKKNECCLDLFSVLPKYQSQGIGKRLQRAGFLYCRDVLGYPYAIVWVFEARTPALLDFYRRTGWEAIGFMAHPNPQRLKHQNARYVLFKNHFTWVKSVL